MLMGFARASRRPGHPKQAPRPERQRACAERDPDPPRVGQELHAFRGNAPQMGQREQRKDDAGGEDVGSHGMESLGFVPNLNLRAPPPSSALRQHGYGVGATLASRRSRVVRTRMSPPPNSPPVESDRGFVRH